MLKPVTEGTADSVAWKAVNLAPSRESYAFAIVLSETRGVAITYTRIEGNAYLSGSRSWPLLYQGRWRLEPHGELQFPFGAKAWCHACPGGPGTPTLWDFVFIGTDDHGQAVRTQFDVRLPGPSHQLANVGSRWTAAFTFVGKSNLPLVAPSGLATIPTAVGVDPVGGVQVVEWQASR